MNVSALHESPTRLTHSAQMEVAFFDTSKTGEITSRLSADTSTVSDQVGGEQMKRLVCIVCVRNSLHATAFVL